MDTARLTDERLRTALNADQASRERLCLGVLALDRNYSNITPRRPEGGPDGSRDIECFRLGERCFGAVGFQNAVSDSKEDKRALRNKFKSDVIAARNADSAVKAFVFFSNVDLSPGEIDDLKAFALEKGFTHIDIYYRERIRMVLDSSEGLGLRFQLLDIELSKAEQAAFFARYGQELEALIHDKFNRIESKLDALGFSAWTRGFVQSLELDVYFNRIIRTREELDHYRVAVELQAGAGLKGDIVLGCRDAHDYRDERVFFGNRVFFCRQRVQPIEESWIGGTQIKQDSMCGIHIGVRWTGEKVHASEFMNLWGGLRVSENLIKLIQQVTFKIDEYVFYDQTVKFSDNDCGPPIMGWPEPLESHERLGWRFAELGHMNFRKSIYLR